MPQISSTIFEQTLVLLFMSISLNVCALNIRQDMSCSEEEANAEANEKKKDLS